MFRPSVDYVETLKETEVGLISKKVDQLVKDFMDSIDELPMERARIVNTPDSVRQSVVDLAFKFFIAGACAIIDRESHYNKDREELEYRRDLN